jgi:hypothetical protein
MRGEMGEVQGQGDEPRWHKRRRCIHVMLGISLFGVGIHVKRDTQLSIAYSQELIFSMSVTLQSTDRHHGIVGQEHCHFQRDS